MLLTIFVVFGFIQHVASIQCFTCSQPGGFCSLPLNLDNGDESNESEIDSANYDADYFCQSDHYFDPNIDTEILILRGIQYCEELDVANHRTHCCQQDNCNQWIPPMTTRHIIYSNEQRVLSSMMLTIFSVVFQYFYK
ncbi:unnamed protein product [Rotaria socialis]|uniref:Uncharacterized protein n=2 Tax=Rotaria socialis TaxID=392032 RepID=A0A818C1J3_9BILA|nr:unnamed protein product [Rotaria socialis]CAF3426589.1 unnamed protein product [Rotaria socialis]CAF3529359.1 unnamed protein product [Rotaria socialis]CAF3777620.1 unnamed protein product [Rotaria socialis]CAF4288849.1 unnamed protein product [Rotaria socialis]